MSIQRKSFFIIRMLIDSFIINSIMIFILSTIAYSEKNLLYQFSLLLILTQMTWVFAAKNFGLYDEFRSRDFSYETIALIKSLLVLVITLIVCTFGLKIIAITRTLVAYFLIISTILLTLEKYFIRKILHFIRINGKNLNNILIIGSGKVGQKFYTTNKNNPHFGYNWIGFVDDNENFSNDPRWLGKIQDLEKILSSVKVDDIIIALPNYASQKIEFIIKIAKKFPLRVKIIPDYFKYVNQKNYLSMFGDFPLVLLSNEKLNDIHWRIVKRIFDLIFSSILFLTIFFWFFPLIIILQLIFNPGPIFYKAKRWGRGGKEFYCYKFRTMKSKSQSIADDGTHLFTRKNDSRITKFGKILRKLNIDELPQFFNVLIGNMSIVGPRPHDSKENEEIKDKINSYMWRHNVKPGITGWAQINGFRGGTSDLKLMEKRTEFDLYYIENWSIFFDLQIIFLTILKILKGDPNAY